MSEHHEDLPKGPPRRAGRCSGCAGAVSGSGDLLCGRCWARVPRGLVKLYRLVWRLVQAGLVEEEAQRELEEVLARTARVHEVPALKRTRTVTAAPLPESGRGAVTAVRLAALPQSEQAAVSASELAALVGHDRNAVGMWCTTQRRQSARSPLRAVNRAPAGVKPRWVYWRAA
ncbi:MAG: hypothetical protein ACYC0B_01980 [Gemmatimonadaceae bacterium]